MIHRTTASPAVTPAAGADGMVVGLQLDGLEQQFEELLEEETVPLQTATCSCCSPTASARR